MQKAAALVLRQKTNDTCLLNIFDYHNMFGASIYTISDIIDLHCLDEVNTKIYKKILKNPRPASELF